MPATNPLQSTMAHHLWWIFMVWRCAARKRPLSCPLWAVVGAYPPEAPHLLQDRLRLCEALEEGKTGDDRQRDCHRNPNEIFSEHLPQSSECVVQMRSLIGGLSWGCSPGECRLQLSLSFPSLVPVSPQRAQPRRLAIQVRWKRQREGQWLSEHNGPTHFLSEHTHGRH